ncbi:hypothetical protein Micbo1qcDRAFT_146268 [Microdochium bolleyi]|uniref:Inositol polyphosphate-related phosphatase domain-containing protein n=1 Tax=Microdochium bolleyi TaxID=196109 RepID=A0A136J7W8_9PEZI|nr:hypothetical protein Micbo1qcDRAFT_146268 [Microdochium bolleyi]
MDADGKKEGPDGSSLQPVSSLRARWENMNKLDSPATPNPPRSPTPRTRSPSPKPPPVPDTRPSRDAIARVTGEDSRSRSVEKHEPPTLPAQSPAVTRFAPESLALASPRPTKPPAVLIEPPHSPPKLSGGVPLGFGHDTNGQLSADPTKPGLPSTPTVPSSRPLRSPSRPTTPTPVFEPRLSPRLAPHSQPPSPPPPRRSGELRREPKTPAAKIPPPVNRAEKPGNRLSSIITNAPNLSHAPVVAAERSPFSSPPQLASSPEAEEPPVLPTRPARPLSQRIAPARMNTLPTGFEPPPVHHAVANRRRDQEASTHARSSAIQRDDHNTITRHQSLHEPSRNGAPPKPPRPGVITSQVTIDSSLSAMPPPKRIVSTPASQYTPRGHGRSMTVGTADQPPPTIRNPTRRIVSEESKAIAEYQEPIENGSTPAPGPTGPSSYPDASNINRRLPLAGGVDKLAVKYDARLIAACGQFVCTTGAVTRVWNLQTGDLLASFAPFDEGVRGTAIAFKPGHLFEPPADSGIKAQEEGTRIWVGSSVGEIIEFDLVTKEVVGTKTIAHGHFEVIQIHRYKDQLWTLDEGGTLNVWGPSDQDNLPRLGSTHPHQTFRLSRGHTFSMVVGSELWLATGKDIRIYAPTVDGSKQVQVLMRPLVAAGAGEVTSGTLLASEPNKVFLGHADGKISIYSRKDWTCLEVVGISSYKIASLAGVGNYLWAGYNSGKLCVYDITNSPWVVKKDFVAHNDKPVVRLVMNRYDFHDLERLQLLSLGADNIIRIWDGLLEDDFKETVMKARYKEYSTTENLKVLVMTWNAGAATPTTLRKMESDANFFPNLLRSSGSPDILVFGFQELVDLEDKTATAKRFFKSKKKDAATDQEQMSHQYRAWRDFLMRTIDDDERMRDDIYHLLHTSTLVGLFTCIFVKSSIRSRIRNLKSGDVKRGLSGYHGNKGAIVVRFFVDDTSLCFVNCHLAAGQSHTQSRHTDIYEIMAANVFRPKDEQKQDEELQAETTPQGQATRIDSYTGGGNGWMILDHELCLLNGDLNYRIDTMSRDTVVNAVKANNLAKLLERDQLLVARRRNPAFRLRAFEEMPITFAPTYKYDVGTDNYDTSEKKRSPAWCDRILHRGGGNIQQLDYNRHEVRVSDHRPVTGRLKFTVKKVIPEQRNQIWEESLEQFRREKVGEALVEKRDYLTNVCGYDTTTSAHLIPKLKAVSKKK